MIAARKRNRWRGPRTLQDATLDRESSQVASLSQGLSVHPLVAQLLLLRGMTDAERAQRFLQPRLSDLNEPTLIPGLAKAARRIAQAVADKQPIVVFGDYDVDGVTASAILWHMLTTVGAKVQIYIPHRIDEGYGLNCEAIRQLAQPPDGRTPLIVSVDCGITAVEPAAAARELGVDLIITDHHQFDADALPHAHTLVHPGLEPDDETTAASDAQRASAKNLCGAGVAYKLAWQFARVHCQTERLPDKLRQLMVDLLSLVALGTVADVVPLVDENRLLTVFGLQRIRHTPFAGVNALLDAARLRNAKVNAYDVGFKLGPRLNACGRMGHAEKAAYLLTQADESEAAEIATFLTRENDRRRQAERAIFQEARQMVLDHAYHDDATRAIVLGKDNWHPGVIGIVASRLVEAFHRPVVMLNIDNGAASGSARSVDGVCIHEAIQSCEDLLDRFGGHAMAAGLGLPSTNIDAFREKLVAHVNERLAPQDLAPIVEIDAPVTLHECTHEVFAQIEQLAPFGRGNRSPRLLLSGVTLHESPRRVGKQGDHLSLQLRDEGRFARAIAFGMGDRADDLPAGTQVDVVFEPKTSTWQGRARAELHVADVRVC